MGMEISLGERELAESVYESLLGDLMPEYSLDWVRDIFIPGHPCHDTYSRMREAYTRVCDRLGVEEDRDVDAIVDALLDHCRAVSTEMFFCCRIYEKKQNCP